MLLINNTEREKNDGREAPTGNSQTISLQPKHFEYIASWHLFFALLLSYLCLDNACIDGILFNITWNS